MFFLVDKYDKSLVFMSGADGTSNADSATAATQPPQYQSADAESKRIELKQKLTEISHLRVLQVMNSNRQSQSLHGNKTGSNEERLATAHALVSSLQMPCSQLGEG